MIDERCDGLLVDRRSLFWPSRIAWTRVASTLDGRVLTVAPDAAPCQPRERVAGHSRPVTTRDQFAVAIVRNQAPYSAGRSPDDMNRPAIVLAA